MAPSAQPATVVVADGDAVVRDVITMKLELAGLSVATCTDGVEALRLVRELVPAACVLGSTLPALSGLDVLASVHGEPATSRVPIVLIAPSGEDLDDDALRGLGAAGWVGRPFNPREVLDLVEALLDRG